MAEEIRPFKVDIPRAEHDRLLRKLGDTRLPTEIVPDAGDDYGISQTWYRDMYWLKEYDWYKHQSFMNQWPHYQTTIKAQNIHFVHARSQSQNAIPILLIHGWPGSFFEFSQLTNLLTSPADSSAQSFHCVVPSLPGFGFSSGPPRGQTVKDVAGIFHILMQRLGYDRYAIQAGDWGAWVARELCANAKFAQHVIGIHFNWIPAPLPPDLDKSAESRERTIHAHVQAWLNSHLAYAQFMRTRPSSLGFMLNDNPTAILTFIGEKFHEASNPQNPLVKSNTWKDHVLTTVCLYYFTNCANTASLIYFENIRHEKFPEEACKPENRVRVPMGYTSFLFDTRPSVKWGVEQTGNLVHYRERDNAGHFAALEDPDSVAEDLRVVIGKAISGEVNTEAFE